MGRYSILPTSWEVYETWIVRAFLLFALITLGPWILVFLYDILYYLVRYVLWELPVIGGKARGRRRPEPVKLIEHATGHKKAPSLAEVLPSLPTMATATATDHQADISMKARAARVT